MGVFKNDDSVIPAKRITALVQTLTLPGPLSVGYSPSCYIRTSHSAMRIAEVILVPQQPISCDTFDKCPNLARIAMLEGHTCCASVKLLRLNKFNTSFAIS